MTEQTSFWSKNDERPTHAALRPTSQRDRTQFVSSWPIRFAISVLLVVAIYSMTVVAAPTDRAPDEDRRNTRRRLSCQQSIPALKLAPWANNFLATKLRCHVPRPRNKQFCFQQVRLVWSSHGSPLKVMKWNLHIHTVSVYNTESHVNSGQAVHVRSAAHVNIRIRALELQRLHPSYTVVQNHCLVLRLNCGRRVRCGHHY